MKIDAVSVTSANISSSIKFYSVLGFDFSDADLSSDHIEPKTTDGSVRLMIDSVKLIKSLTGIDPKPANHSFFAIKYSSARELNEIAKNLSLSGFKIFKKPWDAFWGQRYAIVEDPDGYKVDLFAELS